jgi:MFS family permease
MAVSSVLTAADLELDRQGRVRVLVICCVAVLLTGIDATIVNVALPTIRHDLHASLSGLQWTVDAYALVLASLMMLSGSMADRFGRRRVFLLGLVVFTAGSALCATAPSLDVLIAARALQAVGGRDAGSVGALDHPNHVSRPSGACPRDRDVGRSGEPTR